MPTSSNEADIPAYEALVIILLAPFAIYARGMIITILWRYFIADPFHVMHLGIMHAIGLSFFVSAFKSPSTIATVSTNKLVQYVEISFIHPFIFLVLGVLVHYFM